MSRAISGTAPTDRQRHGNRPLSRGLKSTGDEYARGAGWPTRVESLAPVEAWSRCGDARLVSRAWRAQPVAWPRTRRDDRLSAGGRESAARPLARAADTTSPLARN